MKKSLRQGILPFRIERSDEPLVAAVKPRGGLVLVYEMMKALKLPEVIDRELPRPGSGPQLRVAALRGVASGHRGL